MNEYIPGEFLKKAVASKDNYAVRGAIVAVILSDPSFENGEADKAITYAENNGVPVFERHDNDYEIVVDKLQWNKDEFANASTYLQRNFSKERYENIKQMGKKIYAKPVVKQEREQQPFKKTINVRTTAQNTKRDFVRGRRLLLAAAIGVVAATVIIVALKK